MKFASFFSAPVLPTFFCPFFVLAVVIFYRDLYLTSVMSSAFRSHIILVAIDNGANFEYARRRWLKFNIQPKWNV